LKQLVLKGMNGIPKAKLYAKCPITEKRKSLKRYFLRL
jgi:hypothetical protein